MIVIDNIDGNYLAIRVPPNNEFLLGIIRAVPGRSWVPPSQAMKTSGFWKIPVGSVAFLLGLITTNKAPVSITDECQQLLEAYKDSRIELINIKTREYREPVNLPGLECTLYPYQAQGLDFITTGRRVLLADDMGLGKTIQALAAMIQWQPKKVVVFCPNSLKYKWLHEIEQKAPSLNAIVIEGEKGERRKLWRSDAQIKIANYHSLRHDWDIMPLHWDLVIADEATAFKTHATQTAQHIKRLKADMVLPMTGTPLENHLMEMHSIFEFVREGLLPNAWVFKKEYIEYGPGGMIMGYKNVRDFHERVVPFMIRRRKSEVLKELPDKIYERIDVELYPEERKNYRKWRRQIIEEMDKAGKVTALWTQNALVRMLRLKQIVCHSGILEEDFDGRVAKFEALKDIVGSTEDKVVVFTQFVTMARRLAKEFNAPIIEGEVHPQERIAIIEKYQESDQQVLVSTDAGAYGVDIQAASNIVHYDLTWNPAKQAQREDRLHRMGQKNSVTVFNIIANNTIDEYILDVLYRKLQTFELFVDRADEIIKTVIKPADIQAMLDKGSNL